MTYPETINYLESFINYEKISGYPYRESLKLGRIKDFLGRLGNPQYDSRCIHIAGTKGKGSTCAFISYILRQAGFKVGLYTSPHLSDFRERIRILRPSSFVFRPSSHNVFEGMISRQGLAKLVEKLKPAIDKFNQDSEYGKLSFFEVYTALAFIYFKEKRVDFVVLETGLGGRLDATNTTYPLVCAITPISYEHTKKLGNTLCEIAREKAGIIKGHHVTTSPRHQLIVITAPQKEEALEVIRLRCQETGAKLYEVNKGIFYKETKKGFSVKGVTQCYPDLKIKLIGEHQIINACVAIGVVESLRSFGIKISMDAIKKGLFKTVWPGRCEVVAQKPKIVLDGAQNVASVKALKETVRANFKYKKMILVLGISSDKDIKGICKHILPLAERVILTKANNPRGLDTGRLEQIAKDFIADNLKILKAANVKAALSLARKKSSKQDLILVTGSLFVVGEAREVILKRGQIFSSMVPALPALRNFTL